MDTSVPWVAARGEEQLLQTGGSRFDLCTGIHKALRAMLADALLAVGRMNVADVAELGSTCRRISRLMDLCTHHALHKKQLLHEAIEARAPGTSDLAARGCRQQARAYDGLRGTAESLIGSPQSLRPAGALYLYRQLSLLMADSFQRMQMDEAAYNGVLWSNYSDDELEQIHSELMASIAPDAMQALQWLTPYSNPAERRHLSARLEASMPDTDVQAAPGLALARRAAVEWGEPARVVPLRDARIREALNAMHRQPAHPWTVGSLARLCHLSRTAFAVRFRRHTMLPPMSYLAKWRVELAAGMLREERITLDEVAELVGYSSGAILARAYKRILGVAPRLQGAALHAERPAASSISRAVAAHARSPNNGGNPTTFENR